MKGAGPFETPGEDRGTACGGAVRIRSILRYLLWPSILAAPLILLVVYVVGRIALVGPGSVVRGSETNTASDLVLLAGDLYCGVSYNFLVCVLFGVVLYWVARGIRHVIDRSRKGSSALPSPNERARSAGRVRVWVRILRIYAGLAMIVGAGSLIGDVVLDGGRLCGQGHAGHEITEFIVILAMGIAAWLVFIAGYLSSKFASAWLRGGRYPVTLLATSVMAHVALAGYLAWALTVEHRPASGDTHQANYLRRGQMAISISLRTSAGIDLGSTSRSGNEAYLLQEERSFTWLGQLTKYDETALGPDDMADLVQELETIAITLGEDDRAHVGEIIDLARKCAALPASYLLFSPYGHVERPPPTRVDIEGMYGSGED